MNKYSFLESLIQPLKPLLTHADSAAVLCNLKAPNIDEIALAAYAVWAGLNNETNYLIAKSNGQLSAFFAKRHAAYAVSKAAYAISRPEFGEDYAAIAAAEATQAAYWAEIAEIKIAQIPNCAVLNRKSGFYDLKHEYIILFK